MPEEQKLSLHSESLFRKLLGACRQYRYPLFAGLICGLLCYLFIFTHKLPNHDDLSYLFGVGATVKSGRWGLALLSQLIPHYSMPWFHGMATILLITAAMCIVVALFRIRSHLIQALMTAAVIAFPALLGTFGYMFTTIYYGIAFLLAVLSCWFLTRDRWYWAIPAVLCCAFCVGIYQAYIAIVASLLITFLLQQTLFGEESAGKLFRKGLYFLGFLVVSLGLYWVITVISLHICDIDMGRYASNALKSTDSLPQRVKLCYSYFWRVLTDSSKGLVPEGILRWLHCIAMLGTAAEILICGLRKSRLSRLPLLLLLTVLYPMSVTCIYLFVYKYSVHSLVLYSYAMVYVLIAAVADGAVRVLTGRPWADRLRGLGLDAVLGCMALILLCNCFRSNVAALNMFFNYENNYALATSIITQIQMYPDYNHDMKVAIIGRLPEKGEPREFQEIRNLDGVRGFHTEPYSNYENFLEYYLGFGIRFVSSNSIDEIMESEEFQEMPTYPTQGYIRRIGEDLVVKLPADD